MFTVGREQLGGRDYMNLVVVVDGGESPVKPFLRLPEPVLIITKIGIGGSRLRLDRCKEGRPRYLAMIRDSGIKNMTIELF